jgi:hypothetical protein
MEYLVFRFLFGSGSSTRTELVRVFEQEPSQVAICQSFHLYIMHNSISRPDAFIVDLYELQFFTSNFVTSHP